MNRFDDKTASRRYRALLKGMMDPVLTIGFDGIIQEASDSVAQMFGYQPEELIGENIKVLMPEPHHSQHDSYLDRYRRTGDTRILRKRREFEVVRKGGTRIVCELSVSRVDVPGQDEPIFIGNFRDVTDRKQAELALAESERRFRAVFDQELQYVGLLKPDGTTIEINQTALERTRVDRDDVVGLPFWETPWWHHSAEARARVRLAVQAASRGEVVRFETDYLSDNGELRSVDFSVKPLRDAEGEISMLIPEGRDITELKRAQRAETSMLKALASIGESAAVLAHEIKNPITAINVALRAVADHLGEDQQQVLEELAGRMSRLKYLLTRTLSFARPLELRKTECDLPELLQSAIDASSAMIEEKRLEVCTELESELSVHVDADALDEVFVNLVRNAAQALSSKGRIRVSAKRAGPGQVSVAIEDDGPGIAEAMRTTLFQPFVTSKTAGTGLGLAIARKIVVEHEGEIDVGVSDLGGARFHILLPSAQSPRL